MKIKKLSIRNIASIEKADIDFERDLNIKGTDLPSPLFLITGDTGAGKTVILDCIAMALYGTTPRVKGVANRNKNLFRTADNKEISIADVAQYTRLGITYKDECYAKLIFEGNDGVIYTSCFSLGYTTQKNLRTPAWSLVGDNGLALEGSKKEEIRKAIIKAVGINYEQFCRMAMLAQGQFANFLTGEKTEREKILEQLTSTEHFSRYGEAIERIFKRVRQQKEAIQKRIDEEASSIMTPEAEEALTLQFNNLTAGAETIRATQKKYEEILRLWNSLITKNSELEVNKNNLAALTAEMREEAFETQERILIRWDNSGKERDLLARKKEAIGRKEEAKEALSAFGRLFHEIDYHVALREKEVDSITRHLLSLKNFIDGQKDKEALFLNAEVIIEKIRHLIALNTKKDENQATLSILIGKEPRLEDDVKAWEATQNQEALKHRQAMDLRDSLIGARKKLSPDKLSQRLKASADTKIRLEDLMKAMEGLNEVLNDHNKTSELIDSLLIKIEVEKKNFEATSAEYDKIVAETQKAKERYNTMHLSIEENFSLLRIHLSECHAEECPLCGEKVKWDEYHTKDEATFSKILSPLKEEYGRLEAEAAKIKASLVHHSKELNLAAGKLETNKSHLSTSEAKIENLLQQINHASNLAGIGSGIEPAYIPESLAIIREKALQLLHQNQTDHITLTEQLAKVEELQNQINIQIKAIDVCGKSVMNAQNQLAKANNLLNLNRQHIAQTEKDQQNLVSQMNALTDEISPALSMLIPDWNNKAQESILILTEKSKQYREAVEERRKKENEFNSITEALKQIDTIKTDVSLTLSSLNIPAFSSEEGCQADSLKDIKALSIPELTKAWASLLAAVKVEKEKLERNTSIISTNSAILNEYYAETGYSETDLEQLLNMELSIPAIRERVTHAKESLKSYSDAIQTASEAAKHIRQKLTEWSESEEMDFLSSDTAILTAKMHTDSELESVIKESESVRLKLDQNKKLKEKSALLLHDLEKAQAKFEEWDILNRYFGGSRFRTLVQSQILRPLLKKANVYLSRITDRFTLTCSDDNEQLSILVLDRYNKNNVRSVTVLSGGERFMLSLSLSLALSALNKADMNVDILFIDEGFGTLDAASLTSVMDTLRRLPEVAGQNGRRVGIISHREELADQIDVRIKVSKCGEGRSRVVIE